MTNFDKLKIENPWDKHSTLFIGGVMFAGFDRESKYILIGSSSGRGLIKCSSAEIISRDDKVYYQTDALVADGIGELSGKTIRVAGVFGGNLPLESQDGWVLVKSKNNIYLKPPFVNLRDSTPYFSCCLHVKKNFITELICYGFSNDDKHFIIVTSNEVEIFTKNLNNCETIQSKI